MSIHVDEETTLARKLDVRDINNELQEKGYVLIEENGGQRHAIAVLQQLGRLIPQYNGALEHEVRYCPGFDNKAYSQSNNTILAHTEAPGWEPSPQYLALYCHHQAECGGGHTDILDINHLLPLLDREERVLLESASLHFPGPEKGIISTMLEHIEAHSILRFSFNLLTSGEYDPPLTNHVEPEKLPLGKKGLVLAHKINKIFIKHCSSILIPDDGLFIWDNQRLLHARSKYEDKNRHLTRYWIS